MLGYNKRSFFYYKPESRNNEVSTITTTAVCIKVLDYLYDFNQKDIPYTDYGADCTAPTIDSVLRWLRSKGINVFAYFTEYAKWVSEVRFFDKASKKIFCIEKSGFNSYGHDSYELAILPAIDYVLKHLIAYKHGNK